MSLDAQVLAQCEREQLHLSGAIQPHGTLLVADAAGTITHAAQNIEAYLGAPADAWLGQSLPEALATFAKSLAAAPGSRRWTVLVLTPNGAPMQVVLTRGANNQIIAELVPQPTGDAASVASNPQVVGHKTPKTREEMAADEAAITEQVAALTHFQRVMYYRFREDGDGEVITEARRGDSYGSYLGLRFPASDIPRVARQLYLKNPWRMIPDAAAAPVSVLSKAAEAADLTYSDLRSVSPVHQVYLGNMGVVASLSFPVVMRGELVGLVAAHHSQVQSLSLAVLEQCSQLVSRHAQTAISYDLQQTLRRQDMISQRVEQLRPLVTSREDVEQNWDVIGRQLITMFHADGVRLCFDDTQLEHGLCGSAADRAPLEEWFVNDAAASVKNSDNIRRYVARPMSENIAGVMGIDASGRGGPLRVFLSRREHIHEVAWGGNPDKPMEAMGGPLPIAPRRSFEKWVEKRFGYCRPWNAEERHLALALRVLLLHELR